MKRRLTNLAVIVLTSTLALSACSSSDSSNEQTNSGTGTAQNVPQLADNNGSTSGLKDGLILAADSSKNPASAKSRKDTFIAGISQPEGVFNPYFYHNGWDGNVTSVMFASLLDIDKSGKPYPVLAEKWDVSDDQLKYTFHLRPNLKFSDGSPLTADDVSFTLTILHDKSYDGEEDIFLANIKGGKDYKDGKASSVAGIKVVDPQTIEITTEQVSAIALRLLGGPVLSKAYYGKDYAQGKLDYIRTLYAKPIGAGPYKFDKFVPGQEVRFTANENYYAGKPAIPNLIFKITTPDTNFQLLQTGETDYDGFTANIDNFDQLKSLGFANINLYTSSDYGLIEFNVKKPYLNDKKIRQALIYGLDRKKIIDTFYQGFGQVANEPISPVSWAYTDDVNKYNYDLNKAKQLLEEAGWKAGTDGIREKDGQKLKLNYLGSKSRALNNILVPIAKENYKDLGVSFEAELLDFNALLAKRKAGNYDLANFATDTLLDPNDGVLDFSSKSPTNQNGYSNPKVDELIAKGLGTLDIEKRKPIYKELYKEISDDPPVIFLYNRKVMSAHNSRIKGLDPDTYSGINGSLPKLKIE